MFIQNEKKKILKIQYRLNEEIRSFMQKKRTNNIDSYHHFTHLSESDAFLMG